MFFEIQNFKAGLDSRRSELTTQPGALETLQNAHVNQGGEIEKRKAFVDIATLPTGTDVTYGAWKTFGIEVTSSGVTVFGHVPQSIITAAGYTGLYQQLKHPFVYNGGTFVIAAHAMTAVLCSTSFGGNAWVVAKFADGCICGYNNGIPIPAFYNGLVLNSAVGTAQVLPDITQQLANYIAGVSGLHVGAVTANGANYYFDMWSDAGFSYSLDVVVPGQTLDSNGNLVVLPGVSNNAGTGNIVATNISTFSAGITGAQSTSQFTVTGGSFSTSLNVIGTLSYSSGGVYDITSLLVSGNKYSYVKGATNDSSLVVTGVDPATLTSAGTFLFKTGDTVKLYGNPSTTINVAVVPCGGIQEIYIYDQVSATWKAVLGKSVWFQSFDTIATFVDNIAAQIDTYTSGLNISAVASNNSVLVSFAASLGASPNGDNLRFQLLGDCCLDNTVFEFNVNNPLSSAANVTSVKLPNQTDKLAGLGYVYTAGVKVITSQLVDGVTYYYIPNANDTNLVMTVTSGGAVLQTLSAPGSFTYASANTVTLNGIAGTAVTANILTFIEILGATVTSGTTVVQAFVIALAKQIQKYCRANSLNYTASYNNTQLIVSRSFIDTSLPFGGTTQGAMITSNANVVDGSSSSSGSNTTVSSFQATIFPNPLAYKITTQYPNSLSLGTVSVAVLGGVAPYTYVWSLVVGQTSNIAVSLPTTNPQYNDTVSFTVGNMYISSTYSAQFQCLVTDATGKATVAYVTVVIYYVKTNP